MLIKSNVNTLILEKYSGLIHGYYHLSVSDGINKRFFCCEETHENFREAAIKMITTTPQMSLSQAVDMARFVDMWRTENCLEYMGKTALEIEEMLR